MKKILPLLLCTALLLSGCSLFPIDAAGYVEGLLRHNYYYDISDEYLSMVLVDRETAEADYRTGLHHDAEKFFAFFEMEHNHELDEPVMDYYALLNQKVVFDLDGSQRRNGSIYEVDVTVTPILLFESVTVEKLDEALDPVWAKYAKYTQEDITDALTAEFDADYVDALLGLLTAELENLTYGEPEVVTLHIEKDKSGYYQLNMEDFAALDAAVIKYE